MTNEWHEVYMPDINTWISNTAIGGFTCHLWPSHQNSNCAIKQA